MKHSLKENYPEADEKESSKTEIREEKLKSAIKLLEGAHADSNKWKSGMSESKRGPMSKRVHPRASISPSLRTP